MGKFIKVLSADFSTNAIDSVTPTPDPEPTPSTTEDLTNYLIQGFIDASSGKLYYEGGPSSSSYIPKYVLGTQAGSVNAAAFSIDDDIRITIPAGCSYRVRATTTLPSATTSTTVKDLTAVTPVTTETIISTADFKDACTTAGLLYWNANLSNTDGTTLSPAQAIEKGIKIIKYNS